MNVAGLEGFVWWLGVVENRIDPLKLGRSQVRIFHWHDESKELMATADLKWASSATPINNDSPIPPKDGQWVMGFYLDGKDGQMPMMMFTLPGFSDVAGDRSKGFNDQRTDEQLKTEPRPPKSKSYDLSGKGVTITERDKAERFPNKEYLVVTDEPTTPRLARNEPEEIKKTFIQERKEKRIITIPIVNKQGVAEWQEEKTKYDSKYPFNKVYETEAGHIIEVDDTYGKERIQIAHRSGTFLEIEPMGNSVFKVVKDNYQIMMSEDNTLILGNSNVTIMKDGNIYIKGDMNMRVDGNTKLKIAKNFNIEVGGNMTTNVMGEKIVNVSGDFNTNVGSDIFTYSHKQIEQVSKEDTKIYALQNVKMKATGIGYFETGGAMHNKAGGAMFDQASHIHHNEGATGAGDAAAPEDVPAEILPGTPKTPTFAGTESNNITG